MSREKRLQTDRHIYSWLFTTLTTLAVQISHRYHAFAVPLGWPHVPTLVYSLNQTLGWRV